MAKGVLDMIGTLNGETERLLAEGQDAARKGDKASARSLLTQVVERDPHHEMAWMWLSGVVEEPEEQQICLENVLVINPQNTKARRGLEYTSSKTGIPPHYPPVPDERNTSTSEYTAPLSADSPMFSELSGQWPSSNELLPAGADGGSDSSAALLGWMQSPASTSGAQAGNSSVQPFMPQLADNTQEGSWGSPANLPFSQEQLDWNQPASQFNVMSLADGVDDRLSQLEAGSGSIPPWGESSFQQSDTFGAALGTGLASAGAGVPLVAGGAPGVPLSMMGPMGLHSDSNLPLPSDLPKFDEPAEQPWYLQSEQVPATDNDLYTGKAVPVEAVDSPKGSRKKDLKDTMECPHCKATVADTSLTCPQCRYSFFINCPHCHELVDAADAKQGTKRDCPYCDKPLDLMELAMAGTDSAISYKSTKSSSSSMSKEAMERLEAEHKIRPPMSFRWVTDVVWLVAIIAVVWALSQLPTWLRLTGQY